MRHWIRRLIFLLLCCLVLTPSASAEDVCTVDASAATVLTTECAYLRVQLPLEAETNVTLSVWDEWGYLLYQRNYGACSGTFRSRDVHLPLDGDSCEYTVVLTTDAGEHTFTVVREMAMITDSAVYAGGATLKELVNGSSRKYAVVLDLDTLRKEPIAAPMMAAGMQVGEVVFSMERGELKVSARLTVEGQIDKANVYIATDALTAQGLGTNKFSGVKTRLDRATDLQDTPYAAVMVQLTVTYNPATAQAYEMTREEEKAYEQLLDNWQLMQLLTANEAVG